MKKIVMGMLAHVDAGKTTLTESLLYQSGVLRHLGRVDHGDAFLDYDNQEKSRGITIFSKQTSFTWNDCQMTIIDTPGHVDFSAEMERTLRILDYAILVISGIAGVQLHTETIWKLLQQYQIPTFIFVNKMDSNLASQEMIMDELRSKLDSRCLDFSNFDEHFFENVALSNEQLLNDYLNQGIISDKLLANSIQKREIFPCFFGSALKLTGIDYFLDQFSKYTLNKKYPDEFGGLVYKITHEDNGLQLTHVKITGGTLNVKDRIENGEKVDQIRIYSGNKYTTVDKAMAGDICVLTGLKDVEAGRGLGFEKDTQKPLLTSYMSYRVILEPGVNQKEMLDNLLLLAKEDPQLDVTYHEESQEISVSLMGEIQIEILKNLVKERFNKLIDFDHGKILYKETLTKAVEGVGHFEPLRHYAEVHLLIEPGPLNSGLQFYSDCKEDVLALSYQRLILSHLQEKVHRGVLIGAPVTDLKITLISGRAHLKHTEGGDFREATYRAMRHGLKMSESIILEPYYQFTLEIPQTYLSKAIFDLDVMKATYQLPETHQEMLRIVGQAPVRLMQDYQSMVINYTKGKGRLYCNMQGYQPCLNQSELIEQAGYDSESDLDNPTGSVFCSHGSGFIVPYQEVENYMHLPYRSKKTTTSSNVAVSPKYESLDDELEGIFAKTYGPVKQRSFSAPKPSSSPLVTYKSKPNCLLVDGYNIIHAWPELKDLAQDNLDAARTRLIDIMCNYQGFKKCILILVFDAYKVKDNLGETRAYHNIYVAYTKEAQTADMYIERATHEMADEYQITVATSDALEQLIVLGNGGIRISARELYLEVIALQKEKLAQFRKNEGQARNYLLEELKDWSENDE